MASSIEEIAAVQRKELLKKNTFNGMSEDNKYSAGHTRAKADQKTPDHGRGTSVYLDTENGGTDRDINGVPDKSGSGRIGNTTFNQYNKDNVYKHPDTSNNEGQVRLK